MRVLDIEGHFMDGIWYWIYIVANFKYALDLIGEMEKIRGKFVNLSAETHIGIGEVLRKLYDIMQTK